MRRPSSNGTRISPRSTLDLNDPEKVMPRDLPLTFDRGQQLLQQAPGSRVAPSAILVFRILCSVFRILYSVKRDQFELPLAAASERDHESPMISVQTHLRITESIESDIAES